LVESQGKGQSIEIQVEKIEILGECDPEFTLFNLKNIV
jgi:aspartyl/asparaginyl-tRNA synthetase